MKGSVASRVSAASDTRVVTVRAFLLGLLLSGALAALNAWIENLANVHFLGGVQMPFGAIFSLATLILMVNGPLKLLRPRLEKWRGAAPLSGVELLTIYVMMSFAALISTPGNENFVLTLGPALFYFSTRENGWANLFYSHIPRYFAPGWNGQTFEKQVIEPWFLGGLSISQIPWHAWSAMLLAWGIFASLIYASLFFASLALRGQWIENEALTFPLVQLPLQMIENHARDETTFATPPAREFWRSRGLWAGVTVAFGFHLLRGLNFYFPDWPALVSFQGNVFTLAFPDVPWSSIGNLGTEYFLGAIGLAFLLTRELSFSFWCFFLLFKLQNVAATLIGFPTGTLPRDSYVGNPTFLTWQSVGGWLMMALSLAWSARGHFHALWHAALFPSKSGATERLEHFFNERFDNEPFSPRFVFVGLGCSVGGLLFWCWFAGLNFAVALAFFGLYAGSSLVVARLVVEGGFLFPQATFAPLETLGGLAGSGLTGSAAMSAGALTKLSWLQLALFSDMRTNLLPAFLHALKIAFELKLKPRQTRRLMGCALASVAVSWAVSTFATIATLYSNGGLATYGFFARGGPQNVLEGTAHLIGAPPQVAASNWGWMSVGALAVWLMTLTRARFFWFPLHPLPFIVAGSYPLTKLWLSFFIGWSIKTLLLKFAGQEGVARARPLMMGLILGNAAAMMCWMIYGFFVGSQIPFWPA